MISEDATLRVPVRLADLLELFEAEHSDAMRLGSFDLADRWRALRDALADLLHGSDR
jgi:hypothetical protein